MDAKSELRDKLCEMFPGEDKRIAELLSQYSVRWEAERIQSDLRQRINTFLVAKKIDGLSPKTLKNYREMLNAFAAQVDKHVAQITTDDIRGYIGYLAEERKLKDSSIQTHINTLRSFFSWLEVEEVIKKNPTAGTAKGRRAFKRLAAHPPTHFTPHLCQQRAQQRYGHYGNPTSDGPHRPENHPDLCGAFHADDSI